MNKRLKYWIEEIIGCAHQANPPNDSTPPPTPQPMTFREEQS